MTDTIVQLGDFAFAGFEVPEEIPFGGAQQVAVHRLVGGKRVVDSMGADPHPPEWSGIFVGSNALDRALYLDGLRKAGKPLALTWSQLRYTVIIVDFECTFRRAYRLPYRIRCEVVSDDAAPISGATGSGIDQLVTDDMATATGYSDQIGDGTLSGMMSTLHSAISGVSSFAKAAQAQIAAVLTPLQMVRTQVGILMQSADLTLANVASVGGVLPNNPIAQQVTNLTNAMGASADLPVLLNLDRTLGRIGTNLSSLGSGTRSATVAGGNLFSVAASQYGDAMGWTAIAKANGLSDPQVSGIATLTVPTFSNDTGGVLDA